MNPIDDADLIAGRKARDRGKLALARMAFERAGVRGNPMALFELLQLCLDLNDEGCVAATSEHLARLATTSGDAAYIASMAWEIFDETQRNAFLIRGADLGFPAAQLDAAANLAFGLNGFTPNAELAEKYLQAAESSMPAEAQQLRKRIAGANMTSNSSSSGREEA